MTMMMRCWHQSLIVVGGSVVVASVVPPKQTYLVVEVVV